MNDRRYQNAAWIFGMVLLIVLAILIYGRA